MRRKPIQFMISCVLILCCLFSTCVSATTVDEIEKQKQETQNAIDDAAQKKKEAQEEASSLKQESNELLQDYNALYSQLASINDKIASANASIVSTQSEMTQLEEELEEAKASEQHQYEAMKTRMVYFYENSTNMNVFLMLFTSGSIEEFINRASMISEIMNYDRELLESYQKLQETIASKSETLAKKAKELEGYEASLSSAQGEMDELVSAASGNLSAKYGELSAAEGDVAAYDAQIEALQGKMKSLEAQAAQAQADAAKAIADQLAQEQASGTIEDTSGATSASDSDVIMLAATIQAESDNQSYEGKLAVGSVIMNRVKSSKFPNSISGVITQAKQFASYSSGMVTAIMAKGPNDTCMSVAKEVIAGKRNGNWLFFMTKPYADKFGITGYTQIGDHVFFLIWGANSGDSSVPTQTTEENEPQEESTPIDEESNENVDDESFVGEDGTEESQKAEDSQE